MIWTLEIECVSGISSFKECKRVIEIDSSATLLDLHSAIQDAVDFDDDHLFEFYAGRDKMNKKIRFANPISPLKNP